MIAVNIIAVGKIKEKYINDGIAEYAKRLSRFCKFSVIEVAEEPSKGTSAADIEEVKRREGIRILGKLKGYSFALVIGGQAMSSKAFANKLSALASGGVSVVNFIIGGSDGLSEDVIRSADATLTFGDFTFPHQLMRLILTEQIYRAFMINGGGVYHK